MNESFVFYKSFFDAIKEFDNDTIAEFFKLVCQYALEGDVLDTENKVAKALFQMTMPQIDANKKRRENGRKGGAPAGNNNAQKTTKKQPKNNLKQPNVNLENNLKQPNVNVNVNDIGYISNENNLLKKEEKINFSSKKRDLEFDDKFNSLRDEIEMHSSWREVMSKKHNVHNFDIAFAGFKDWIVAKGIESQIQSVSDFKNKFNTYATYHLTAEAKRKPKEEALIINGIVYT